MTSQYLTEIEDKLREISRLVLDYSLKVEHPAPEGVFPSNPISLPQAIDQAIKILLGNV